MGLFSSLRCSVIAKAAAVATSRPKSVTVVRTRCKARRFYGPLVNEVEESGALGRGARVLAQHHAHGVDREDDEEGDETAAQDPVCLRHVEEFEPGDDQ